MEPTLLFSHTSETSLLIYPKNLDQTQTLYSTEDDQKPLIHYPSGNNQQKEKDGT